VHQISGNIGWVLAPVLVGSVTHLANWRIALLTAGGAALLATLVIALQTHGLGAPMRRCRARMERGCAPISAC